MGREDLMIKFPAFYKEIKCIKKKLKKVIANGAGSGAGEDGASAFEIAVANGFTGTQEDWLESLKGEDADNTLTTSSTIVSSRDNLATDADGLNNSVSDTDIVITIVDDATVPLEVGSILMYKRSGDGNISIVGGLGTTVPTHQTYSLDDVITYRKIAANTWETLSPPEDLSNVGGTQTGAEIESLLDAELGNTNWKVGNVGEVNTINSTVTGEPTGATQVLNVVLMTNAAWTAADSNNETITGTMYVITDVPNTFYFGNTVISNEYTDLNVLNPENDTNALTGLTAHSSSSIASFDNEDGTYSLAITPIQDGTVRHELIIPIASGAGDYELSFKARETTGADMRMNQIRNEDGSTVTITSQSMTDTETTYSQVITTTGTYITVSWFVYGASVPYDNHKMYIDDVSLIKQ